MLTLLLVFACTVPSASSPSAPDLDLRSPAQQLADERTLAQPAPRVDRTAAGLRAWDDALLTRRQLPPPESDVQVVATRGVVRDVHGNAITLYEWAATWRYDGRVEVTPTGVPASDSAARQLEELVYCWGPAPDAPRVQLDGDLAFVIDGDHVTQLVREEGWIPVEEGWASGPDDPKLTDWLERGVR